jgi:hypothetical protein
MPSVLPDRRRVNVQTLFETALQAAHAALLAALSARMNELLGEAVDHLLGRPRYVRRGHVPDAIQGGRCPHCRRQQSNRFTRHGGRRRTVTIWWGDLQIYWPRVRCACGHCVELNLAGWLEPYQRLGTDVDVLIQRWGALCLSLRQMAAELAHSHIAPLALRTLTQRLQQLQSLTPELATQAAPPIVQVDGFYITQLRPNGEVRTDAKGRKRAVKGRFKRCVLIALGVWPERGRQEVLAWTLTNGEDFMAWLSFLTRLEEAGIAAEHGLQVIIHDGGPGLCAARRFLDLGVAEQRCLFHKLRNIRQALTLPDELLPEERRRRQRTIMQDFRSIWQAKHYQTALRRYLAVWRHYRTTQPKAVAALRADFRTTVAFYALERQHPAWHRHFLRTTNRLERFNRKLRKHCRAAGAYHSDVGILAMLAQTADESFRPRPANTRVCYIVPTK